MQPPYLLLEDIRGGSPTPEQESVEKMKRLILDILESLHYED